MVWCEVMGGFYLNGSLIVVVDEVDHNGSDVIGEIADICG